MSSTLWITSGPPPPVSVPRSRLIAKQSEQIDSVRSESASERIDPMLN